MKGSESSPFLVTLTLRHLAGDELPDKLGADVAERQHRGLR